jgi:hypothetical protein
MDGVATPALKAAQRDQVDVEIDRFVDLLALLVCAAQADNSAMVAQCSRELRLTYAAAMVTR